MMQSILLNPLYAIGFVMIIRVKVFSQIGVLQIQAIEQETKMLTQNKLIMKKRTKIIGLVATVLMAAGFMMKKMHLQGAGIVWGVGVLTAVFGFALFLLLDRFSYEKTR